MYIITLAMQRLYKTRIGTIHNNLNFEAFAAAPSSSSRCNNLMSRVAPDKINNNGYYVVSFLHFPTPPLSFNSNLVLCKVQGDVKSTIMCVCSLSKNMAFNDIPTQKPKIKTPTTTRSNLSNKY